MAELATIGENSTMQKKKEEQATIPEFCDYGDMNRTEFRERFAKHTIRYVCRGHRDPSAVSSLAIPSDFWEFHKQQQNHA